MPTELAEALAKAVDKRNHSAYMIKQYTDDWVEAQEKIIVLKEAINKCKGENNGI